MNISWSWVEYHNCYEHWNSKVWQLTKSIEPVAEDDDCNWTMWSGSFSRWHDCNCYQKELHRTRILELRNDCHNYPCFVCQLNWKSFCCCEKHLDSKLYYASSMMVNMHLYNNFFSLQTCDFVLIVFIY